MHSPLVSIIIVTYNAASTLERALESVISQTFHNFEIVVIDGGSKDGTREVIAKYQSHIAHWVSEKDRGIYDAMNKGIVASKGEWVFFLGADDVLFNETVLAAIAFDQVSNAVSFVYGDIQLKSNNKIFGGTRTYRQLVEQNISHQAIFYRRSLFKQVGYFNTQYKVLADYDLNLRIFRDSNIVKAYVPVVVTLFNDKGTSNVAIDKNFFGDQLQYFLQSGEYTRESPELQKYFFFKGFADILQRRRRSGLKALQHALRCGNRKLYFSLVAGKYLLSMAGVGKKIRAY